MTRQRIETTFADLRDGDHLIDKSGKAWPVSEPLEGVDFIVFWLHDPTSNVRLHNVSKAPGDPCSVLRVPTHADELAERVAEVPKSGNPESGTGSATTSPAPAAITSTETANTTEAAGVAEVAEVLGAVTVAEVTAAEVDEANAATEAKPITLPPFEQFTDLEMRSHLYLLHGLYGDDIQPRTHLVAMHEKAHVEQAAGRLQSKFRPHVHTSAVTE